MLEEISFTHSPRSLIPVTGTALPSLIINKPTSLANISVRSEEDSQKFECYKIEINMPEGNPCRGYVAYPRGADPGSLPIYLFVHSAGVNRPANRASANFVLSRARQGYLCLDINAHGYPDDEPQEYYDALNERVTHCVAIVPAMTDMGGVRDIRKCGWSGKSIRPVLEEGTSGQDFVVTETNFKQTAGSYGWKVRTKRYKYVLYDKGLYREQLYDMEKDRGEMRNLAVKERYAPIVAEHREILRKWLDEDPGPERRLHKRFIP